MPLIASGTAAAERGFRVRYTRLVDELIGAADDKQLTKTINRYGRVDHLLLGYMKLAKRGAELLVQVLTEREEKNVITIASSESFSGWTKAFTDPRLCEAIVDRVTFGAPPSRPASTPTAWLTRAPARSRGAQTFSPNATRSLVNAFIKLMLAVISTSSFSVNTSASRARRASRSPERVLNASVHSKTSSCLASNAEEWRQPGICR